MCEYERAYHKLYEGVAKILTDHRGTEGKKTPEELLSTWDHLREKTDKELKRGQA